MPFSISVTPPDTNTFFKKLIVSFHKQVNTDLDSPLVNPSINSLLAPQLLLDQDNTSISLTLDLSNFDEASTELDEFIEYIPPLTHLISFSITPLPLNSKKIQKLLILGKLLAAKNRLLKITQKFLDECLQELRRIQPEISSSEKQEERQELRQKTLAIFKMNDASVTEAIDPFQSVPTVQNLFQKEMQQFEQDINQSYAVVSKQLIDSLSERKQYNLLNKLFEGINYFLCQAESSWKKIEERSFGNLFKDAKKPDFIQDFNLINVTHSADEHKDNNVLINYIYHIQRDIDDVNYLMHKQLRLVKSMYRIHKNKVTRQKSLDNLWGFQETAIDYSMNKAKEYTQKSLLSYLNCYQIGKDRRASANALMKSMSACKNILELISLINTEFIESLDHDRLYNERKSPLFRRKAYSRYRQNLLACKTWIYSLCPPSKLAWAVRSENLILLQTLPAELQRGANYYDKYPTLKSLIQELYSSCQNDFKSNQNKIDGDLNIMLDNNNDHDDHSGLLLARKLVYLKRIRKHADYDSKQCGLFGIYQNLSFLYQRAKTFMPMKDKIHLQTCKSISKALKKLKIPYPSPLCFFSDSYYTIPSDTEFQQLLNPLNNPKMKYYLLQIMTKVKNHLANKYGGDATNITFSHVNANDIQVNLELTDSQTHQKNEFSLKIHIDNSQNRYIVEPLILSKNMPEALRLNRPTHS